MQQKWVDAGIKHGMRMFWQRTPSGLALYMLTVQAENGGQRHKKLLETKLIEEAIRTTLDILQRGGLVDIELLIGEVFWDLGWHPDMTELRHEMWVAFDRSPKYRCCDWAGFAAWRRGG